MIDPSMRWEQDSVAPDKHSLLWAGACALAARRHPDTPIPDKIDTRDALTVQQAVVAHQMRESIGYPVATLTVRQQQVLAMVVDGRSSKAIAFSLGISQRTVENHRRAIMQRTGARSLPELMRFVITATI